MATRHVDFRVFKDGVASDPFSVDLEVEEVAPIVPTDMTAAALRAAVAQLVPFTTELRLLPGNYGKLTVANGGPLVIPGNVSVTGWNGVIRCGAGAGVQVPDPSGEHYDLNVNGTGECELPLKIGSAPQGLGAKTEIRVRVSQAGPGGNAMEVIGLQNTPFPYLEVVNNELANGVLWDSCKNITVTWMHPTRCLGWANYITTRSGNQRSSHIYFLSGLSEGSYTKIGDAEHVRFHNFVFNGLDPNPPQAVLFVADQGRVDGSNNLIGPRAADHVSFTNVEMKQFTNGLKATARVDIEVSGDNVGLNPSLPANSTITRPTTTVDTY